MNIVDEYYTMYKNNTLNLLKQDKFLLNMLQKHRLNKTKDQYTFWTQQVIQAQQYFK